MDKGILPPIGVLYPPVRCESVHYFKRIRQILLAFLWCKIYRGTLYIADRKILILFLALDR